MMWRLGRLAASAVAATAPLAVTPAARAADNTPPSPPATGSVRVVTLELGASGAAVAKLQLVLGVSISGVYDRRTVAAVRAFQVSHGLEPDGVAGPLTWATISGELNGRPGDTVYRHGDRGHRISTLQWALGLPASGRFGLATQAAVRRFQRRHGMVVDGEVGPRTLQALVDEGYLPEGSFARSRRTPPVADGTSAAAGGSDPSLPAAGALGRRAASLSLQYLGRPYVWGGEDPSGFDCSGLVQYVYGRLGVSLPRVARDQFEAGRHVPLKDLAPGDLVFFENLGHVGIYLGRGRFIHAPHTGSVVQIADLDGWYLDNYVGAVRVVPAGG